MEPHLLHDLSARNAGQSMADYSYAQRMPRSRPRKPYPFAWPRRRR